MTANERIEKLLNLCGQTISDLPVRDDERIHLADVIDRMETALHNQLVKDGVLNVDGD